MITYLLEILIFQLAFLLVYDLFLKGETFFQWNRAYLLVTFIISLVLPWVKIEALKTTVSAELVTYPQAFFQLDSVILNTTDEKASFWSQWSWYEWVFYFGIAITTILFVVKLYRIQVLRLKGQKQYYPRFTKVVVTKSSVAFSFFKHVFLGDGIPREKEPNILAHELVHIKQWHSLDLLFFEMMRIVFWFNPLVYIYQLRMSELHEFIADAHVAKINKKEQYQHLLAEVFQTQHISFVNQFFKSSLIKKRIVMLSKTKSKKVVQLKYLLLLPVIMGMLLYTSCEQEIKQESVESEVVSRESDAALISKIENELEQSSYDNKFLFELSDSEKPLSKRDFFKQQLAFYQINLRMNSSQGIEFTQELKEVLLDAYMPSSEKYDSYLKDYEAIKILGENLKVSIDKMDFTIRSVKKEDKNLGSGEFYQVGNMKDLNSEEVRRVNQYLEHIKGTERFLFLSDDNHSFKISSLNRKNENNGYSVDYKVTEIQKEDSFIPFAIVDEIPIFPGCEGAVNPKDCFQESLINHIKKHFNYPIEAQEQGIQGRVSVVFTIAKDGSIINIRKRGPHQLLEEEAERIIKRLPQMTPGKQDGKLVSVPYFIPIDFLLENGRDVNLKSANNKNQIKISGDLFFKGSESYYQGKVTDIDGLGLSGVTINNTNNVNAVISDFRGNFSIKAEKGNNLILLYSGNKLEMRIK